MKKQTIIAIVCLSLAVVFLAVFTGSLIACKYAENHYEVTYGVDNAFLATYKYGCGEIDCKYCNGKTVRYGDEFNEFVYYATLKPLWIISICLVGVFAIAGSTMLIIPKIKKEKN